MRVDASAIDLTEAVERLKSEGDRIQVSTAAGADGIIRRIEVRAREAGQNWAVFALANNSDEQIDRLIVAPHYRMVDSGTVVARPRPVAHGQHHAELGRPAGPPGFAERRHLPHHARSRHGDHLRGRAAHRPAAAALSVGAGRLQGQDQLVHALPRHRHRHRGPARAVPHHPVRREGLGDVSGGRRARLGGAGLYRHRLRILGQGVRPLGRHRACLARLGRGDPRRDAGGVSVRLSQPQPLARALRAHHGRLARVPRRAHGGRGVQSGGRLRRRAPVARDRGGRGARPRGLSRDARLRPRGAADPDLAAARRVGVRREPRGQRHRDQRHRRPRAARRPRADRDADRLHRDAARLRGRRRHRDRLRHRAARARADRLGRHDLGLGRSERPRVHLARDRDPARPEARHARRLGGGLARAAASARPRPLPRRARRRARSAPRPAVPRIPPAHDRRPLHVVRPQGAPGGRLGRRGGAPRRHADRRDRVQDRGRTPAARCRARQPHRPAEPRALSSTGSMPRSPSRAPTPPSARP